MMESFPVNRMIHSHSFLTWMSGVEQGGIGTEAAHQRRDACPAKQGTE